MTVPRVAVPQATSRRTRRRTAAVAALALTALTFTGPSPHAFADRHYPTAGDVDASRAKVAARSQQVGQIEAQLASATARSAQLALDVAQAVEAYNGARVRLQEAVSQAVEAQQKADSAKAGVTASRRELGSFAAAAYRSGGDLSSLSAFLYASGPRDLISRAAALEAIGATRENALDQLRSSQAVAGVLQRAADDMVTKRQSAADAVQAAKVAAEAKLAEQQRVVDDIRGQRAALVRALAAARHTSVRLERAREAGLAAERAAAARRAAAAEAQRRADAQQSSGGGGSSGGGSPGGSGSSGGSSHGTSSGAEAAIAYARDQIGKPYVWAADGPDSFDCSGLTMRAWQQGGVYLPHYSVAQYEQSQKVGLGELRPGDLVFFASSHSDYTSIYHVGLYIGGGQMIEAPYTGENVRISSIWRSSLFGAARP